MHDQLKTVGSASWILCRPPDGSGILDRRGLRSASPVLGVCEYRGGFGVVEAGPVVRISDETCTSPVAAHLGYSARRTLSHLGRDRGGHQTPVRHLAGCSGGAFWGGAGLGPVDAAFWSGM